MGLAADPIRKNSDIFGISAFLLPIANIAVRP